jgi:hypothetical protein
MRLNYYCFVLLHYLTTFLPIRLVFNFFVMNFFNFRNNFDFRRLFFWRTLFDLFFFNKLWLLYRLFFDVNYLGIMLLFGHLFWLNLYFLLLIVTGLNWLIFSSYRFWLLFYLSMRLLRFLLYNFRFHFCHDWIR